jgi:hypothetical protein
MKACLTKVWLELRLWTAFFAASLPFFWVCRGTQLQGFAVGLLASSASLLVLMTLFEVAWQGTIHALRSLGVHVEA